jgi:hypothetical protein
MFKFRLGADTTAPRLSLQYFALRFLDANEAKVGEAFSRWWSGVGKVYRNRVGCPCSIFQEMSPALLGSHRFIANFLENPHKLPERHCVWPPGFGSLAV